MARRPSPAGAASESPPLFTGYGTHPGQSCLGLYADRLLGEIDCAGRRAPCGGDEHIAAIFFRARCTGCWSSTRRWPLDRRGPQRLTRRGRAQRLFQQVGWAARWPQNRALDDRQIRTEYRGAQPPTPPGFVAAPGRRARARGLPGLADLAAGVGARVIQEGGPTPSGAGTGRRTGSVRPGVGVRRRPRGWFLAGVVPCNPGVSGLKPLADSAAEMGSAAEHPEQGAGSTTTLGPGRVRSAAARSSPTVSDGGHRGRHPEWPPASAAKSGARQPRSAVDLARTRRVR